MHRYSRKDANDLNWDYKTVNWFSSGPRGLEFNPGSKLWMLGEDAGNRAWHQIYKVDQESEESGKRAVWLEDCSEDLMGILWEIFPHDGDRHEPMRGVLEFVKSVIQQIVHEGVAVFELVIGRGKDDPSEPIEGARLIWIRQDSIMRFPNAFYQLVPPNEVELYPSGMIIPIEHSKVFVFKSPRKYLNCLRQIKEGLKILEQSELEWMGELSELNNRGENFSDVKNAYNIEIAKLTSKIGWNARGLICDGMSDFHYQIREFTWKIFCASIRDEVLNGIQQVMLKVGQHFQETPALHWDYLPKMEEFQKGIVDLKNK